MGPSTDKAGIMERLVAEGMNVARFNFSHGSYDEHTLRMNRIKEIRERLDKPVAILLDTKGPEVRTGTFKAGKVELKAGQMFTLTSRPVDGDENIVSITYTDLWRDAEIGTRILIDDGLIEMAVVSIDDTDIHCVVKNDGVVSDRKGINIPDIHLNMPYMSEKDRNDILFGIKNDVDFIAASFCRSAEDVRQIRELLVDNGGGDIRIIAKVENGEGVHKIDEIIEAADGVMVARGDMGVELPVEDIPVIQKMIINKAYEAGRQVITATQMLDSMIKNPRPTRAEATDVANAVYDGTSAVMLSGETAAGKYPVEALKTMINIVERAEAAIDYHWKFAHYERSGEPDVTNAICHATCTTAYDLKARAILTVTKSGMSARMVSRYRPGCDIIAGTTSEKVYHQLNMSWGITPMLLEEKKEVFALFAHAVERARNQGYLRSGDVTVITCGVPIGISGTTNMIKVEVVA